MNCYKCNKQATPLSVFYALWISEGKGLKYVTLCDNCINNIRKEDRMCTSELVMRNDVGQNVYRIYERAVECGYITKYSIELSPDCTIDSKKFKKAITANFTDIQGRMHGPSIFTLMGNGLPDGMYKSKEDAEKALIKKNYSHLFKADVLNNL